MVNCQFTSDNATGMHPLVLAMLAKANEGPALPYGDDPWTSRAMDAFHREFGANCEALLVPLGTGANTLALRAMLRPWQSILSSTSAHIRNTESGAAEAVVGAKITSLPTVNGKIKAEDVARFADPIINAHHVQPRVLALTQSTEQGTLYTLDELKALCDTAHANGLVVHMDGTRISNAVAALNCSLRAATRDAGVDVLSFGGTKNGLMMAEAVIFFNRDLAEGLAPLRKQCCQLYSKMRFISAQYVAYFEDGLWRRNAENANTMAAYLVHSLESVQGVRIVSPVEVNGVFATLEPAALTRLSQQYAFSVVDAEHHVARWVCSFNTTKDDVDTFVTAIRNATAH